MNWHVPRHRLLSIIQALCLVLVILCSDVGYTAVTDTAPVTILRNREYGEALLQKIREARSSIYVCFYVFKTTDSRGNMPRRIADELVAARGRGVDVNVYLERNNSRKDTLNDDNRRTAALLRGGGVRVVFDSPAITTHTKTVLVDSRFVFLGSHNLTQSALRHNNEISVLIDSPQLAAAVKAELDRL